MLVPALQDGVLVCEEYGPVCAEQRRCALRVRPIQGFQSVIEAFVVVSISASAFLLSQESCISLSFDWTLFLTDL